MNPETQPSESRYCVKIVIHVERATAADYEQVLSEVTACLSSAKGRVA